MVLCCVIQKKVLLCLLGEVIFMAIIIITSMVAFHSHKKRSLFVGIFCDIFNIIMYSSPLAIWVIISLNLSINILTINKLDSNIYPISNVVIYYNRKKLSPPRVLNTCLSGFLWPTFPMGAFGLLMPSSSSISTFW